MRALGPSAKPQPWDDSGGAGQRKPGHEHRQRILQQRGVLEEKLRQASCRSVVGRDEGEEPRPGRGGADGEGSMPTWGMLLWCLSQEGVWAPCTSGSGTMHGVGAARESDGDVV